VAKLLPSLGCARRAGLWGCPGAGSTGGLLRLTCLCRKPAGESGRLLASLKEKLKLGCPRELGTWSP